MSVSVFHILSYGSKVCSIMSHLCWEDRIQCFMYARASPLPTKLSPQPLFHTLEKKSNCALCIIGLPQIIEHMPIYEPSSTKIHIDWDKDYEQLHKIGENFRWGDITKLQGTRYVPKEHFPGLWISRFWIWDCETGFIEQAAFCIY